jgi:hypothetical protein
MRYYFTGAATLSRLIKRKICTTTRKTLNAIAVLKNTLSVSLTHIFLTHIEKALLSKIYKVDSMSLEELEKQSAEINSTSGRSNKSKDIEQGFLNSSILEDNLNRTYLRIYSDTTQDDILDEAEENDKLSSFKLRFL